MKKYFWDDWKRKTEQEREAIEATRKTLKVVLEEIPKKEIRAIYMKGSFTRREMNRHSDIDPTVILKTNRYFRKIKRISEEINRETPIRINLGALSLWEFKHRKRYGDSKKPRAGPDLFLRKIHQYKILYGKKISIKKYPQRNNERMLKGRIKTFRGLFLPMYSEKKIDFEGLIKQVFWLVETELIFRKKKVPETWKGMAKSIKDGKHIIHNTLYLRNKQKKSKTEREKYVSQIKKYLGDLERL